VEQVEVDSPNSEKKKGGQQNGRDLQVRDQTISQISNLPRMTAPPWRESEPCTRPPAGSSGGFPEVPISIRRLNVKSSAKREGPKKGTFTDTRREVERRSST